VSAETIDEKAVRYLAEGRVRVWTVGLTLVEVEVRGGAAEPYKTRREGERWSCDCPAWQRRCCHVAAAELVT
jgi:uncharacterized Zn finger protein